jgi:hypothetical protein
MEAMEDKMEDKMEDNIRASMEPQEPQKTTEEYSALHFSQVKVAKNLSSVVGKALLY